MQHKEWIVYQDKGNDGEIPSEISDFIGDFGEEL
jgi:hypothetical protein